MKIGATYHVRFYDHVHHTGNGVGLLTCSVYGKLVNEGDLSIHLASWEVEGDTTGEQGRESFTVLKSAIISKRRLR